MLGAVKIACNDVRRMQIERICLKDSFSPGLLYFRCGKSDYFIARSNRIGANLNSRNTRTKIENADPSTSIGKSLRIAVGKPAVTTQAPFHTARSGIQTNVPIIRSQRERSNPFAALRPAPSRCLTWRDRLRAKLGTTAAPAPPRAESWSCRARPRRWSSPECPRATHRPRRYPADGSTR